MIMFHGMYTNPCYEDEDTESPTMSPTTAPSTAPTSAPTLSPTLSCIEEPESQCTSCLISDTTQCTGCKDGYTLAYTIVQGFFCEEVEEPQCESEIATTTEEVTTTEQFYTLVHEDTKCAVASRTFKVPYSNPGNCGIRCENDATCAFFSVNADWCIGCSSEPDAYHAGFTSYQMGVVSTTTTTLPAITYVMVDDGSIEGQGSKCSTGQGQRAFKTAFTTVEECQGSKCSTGQGQRAFKTAF